MFDLISSKNKQINEAIEIAKSVDFKPVPKRINKILLIGMGGSGIGGKIISQLFIDELKVPFCTHHGYGLPNYVDENTLILASSYSGNTEETIGAVREAMERKATICCVTSGGKLKELATENNWNCYIVPGGEQPRAMLIYSVIQQISILSNAGFIANKHFAELEEIPNFLDKNEEAIRSEAKAVAKFCNEVIPVIYTGDTYEPIGIRFRQQLNENAKILCWHHVIPELTHSELVGWAGGSDKFGVVYLNSNFYQDKTNTRWEFVKSKIEEKNSPIRVIEAKGESKLQQFIYLIHLTDWVSYYLSEIRHVDPVEVDTILDLKRIIKE